MLPRNHNCRCLEMVILQPKILWNLLLQDQLVVTRQKHEVLFIVLLRKSEGQHEGRHKIWCVRSMDPLSIVCRCLFRLSFCYLLWWHLEDKWCNKPSAQLLYTAEISAQNVRCKCRALTCLVKVCAFFTFKLKAHGVITVHAQTIHGQRT